MKAHGIQKSRNPSAENGVQLLTARIKLSLNKNFSRVPLVVLAYMG